MNVTLHPRTPVLVREEVESGRYAGAGAVIDEALRVLEERDRLDRLRVAVAIAEAEVEWGEVFEWTPDFFDRLIAEAAEATRAGIPVHEEVSAFDPIADSERRS